MSRLEMNLARRPFLNARPVARLATVLAVGGALLLGLNLWLYGQFWVGSGEKARRLAELERSIAAERDAAAGLTQRIAGLDVARLNTTVAFLNRKIDERRFSWSLLLERLTEVLPADVRLTALGHEGGDERAQPTEPAPAGPRPVPLKIVGEAKTDEALLELLDRLFAHSAFRDPNLEREARQEGRWLRFDLLVSYLPEVAKEPGGGEAAAGEAPEEAGEAAPEETR